MPSKVKHLGLVVFLGSFLILSACSSLESTKQEDQENQEIGQKTESNKEMVEVDNVGDSTHILVDLSDPAYHVFMGVPVAGSAEATLFDLEKAEMTIAEAGSETAVELITLEEFKKEENKEKYFNSVIIHNDYPQLYEENDIIEEFINLVEKNSAGPFGLAWNGGVALTGNDYGHALEGYELYQEDPDAYEEWKPKEGSWDPIYPFHHLRAPLLDH